MKKVLLFALTALSFAGAKAQNCREVIGYYPSWQWYDRSKLVNPMTIDYSKYSIINYSFFNPSSDGTLVSYDSWADQNLLTGDNNLVSRAHNAGVEVLASVGGWTLSNNFPTIAASAASRAMLAHECVQLCSTYGFNGIDIDWEYPGFADHNGSSSDKANYTLMMTDLHDSLIAYGTAHGQTMILTACFGPSRTNMDNIEWNNVKNLVDYINVMTYDFFGSWDSTANHNAPLYAPQEGDTTFNINSAVHYLMDTYDIPSYKINSGVAFYGRSAKTTTTPALFAPIVPNVVDSVTFADDLGIPEYYNIMAKMSLFTEQWDGTAKVPYITGNGSLNTFVSYDNQRSVATKAQYIVDNNLAGAIIWEITGDYMETAPGSGVIAGTPLADTLRSVLCANTPTPNAVKNVNAIAANLAVYPNPATTTLNITWQAGVKSIRVINMTGVTVADMKNVSGINKAQLDVNKYPAGSYIVEAVTDNGERIQKVISIIN